MSRAARGKIQRIGGGQDIHVPAAIVKDEDYPILPHASSVSIKITKKGLLIGPAEEEQGR